MLLLSHLLGCEGKPHNCRGTAELQDEATAIAQELGMKPLLERVLAQRVRLRRMKA